MDQKDEVKSKVDIVEIISGYLPLKKAGRNFAGLCPFHSEKTPSFMISPDRQVFKCFGCGESGDVFTFLEKIEGWEFRETLEELAKRVGVKLERFAPTSSSKLKEKLLEISKLASTFYRHLLEKHPAGEKARQYLLKRGIKKPIWEKYSLGYSPAGWENSLQFLTKRGFSIPDIAASGLVVAREETSRISSQSGGYYDRFRDRLIFPLKDSRGTVLGFAGRVMGIGEPKYLNSPDTPIFNKGSLLFGLDVAREFIRKENETVLVEGKFDVLSANQAGVGHVVASKGTALTDKQVAQLGRLCETVSICFDTDLAGDAAARRGIELLDLAGVNVKVVGLGKYKDPDEYIKTDVSGFKSAIKKAMNIYDYFIQSASI
ncbi:DNA primase, partial [Candidatus Curtissbacteria bacterium RBG_13_40_7]